MVNYYILSHKMRILVVEDDPALNDVLVEALSHRYHECEIDTAASADEITPMMISQASNPKFHYDLIVSDVSLQGEATGFDLWNVVETAFPQTAFLFISGISSVEFLERISGSELCPPYMAKPFSIDEFLDVIAGLLKEKGFEESQSEEDF